MDEAKQETEPEKFDWDKGIMNSNMIKARPCLVKFKSMAEILMEGHAWFDEHGNLCKNGLFNQREHLSPAYFTYLGTMREFKGEVSFPYWCIRAEYTDLFHPNMALRLIASGKFTAEEMVQAAKKAVLIP